MEKEIQPYYSDQQRRLEMVDIFIRNSFNIAIWCLVLFLFTMLLAQHPKIKDWWRARWLRRLAKIMPHIGHINQVEIARVMISNAAVQMPRSTRRKFLAIQAEIITELVKGGIARSADLVAERKSKK